MLLRRPTQKGKKSPNPKAKGPQNPTRRGIKMLTKGPGTIKGHLRTQE